VKQDIKTHQTLAFLPVYKARMYIVYTDTNIFQIFCLLLLY